MNTVHIDELMHRCPVLAPLREPILQACAMLDGALAAGGTLYLCGNGGSAADCEHIAGELLKGYLLPRRLPDAERAALAAAGPAPEASYLAERLQSGLRAVALTGHPALTTAVGNDNGADLAFAQQVWALGRPGDVLLAISTSGNARNVLLAAIAARAKGMRVLALTGAAGGRLLGAADLALRVPESVTFRVQELHLPLYHALCATLETERYGAV